MWKAISGILVGLCLASSQAMAIDATWYCSTIFEGHKDPKILKFEVKDGSLFGADQKISKINGPDVPSEIDTRGNHLNTDRNAS